jgi:hypothetical protein
MPQALSARRAGDAYPFRAAAIRFAQEIRVRPDHAARWAIAASAAVAAHND